MQMKFRETSIIHCRQSHKMQTDKIMRVCIIASGWSKLSHTLLTRYSRKVCSPCQKCSCFHFWADFTCHLVVLPLGAHMSNLGEGPSSHTRSRLPATCAIYFPANHAELNPGSHKVGNIILFVAATSFSPAARATHSLALVCKIDLS